MVGTVAIPEVRVRMVCTGRSGRLPVSSQTRPSRKPLQRPRERLLTSPLPPIAGFRLGNHRSRRSASSRTTIGSRGRAQRNFPVGCARPPAPPCPRHGVFLSTAVKRCDAPSCPCPSVRPGERRPRPRGREPPARPRAPVRWPPGTPRPRQPRREVSKPSRNSLLPTGCGAIARGRRLARCARRRHARRRRRLPPTTPAPDASPATTRDGRRVAAI